MISKVRKSHIGVQHILKYVLIFDKKPLFKLLILVRLE